MRRTILATALALSMLPTIHAAQADTVIDTRPLTMDGDMPVFGTVLGEELRRLRAPRTWRTAGPMAKRQWRAEQLPVVRHSL